VDQGFEMEAEHRFGMDILGLGSCPVHDGVWVKRQISEMQFWDKMPCDGGVEVTAESWRFIHVAIDRQVAKATGAKKWRWHLIMFSLCKLLKISYHY
jgi:transposase